MKKLFLVLLFLSVTYYSYSQTDSIITSVEKTDIIEISDIAEMDSLILEDDGFWRNRYNNGNIKSEGLLKKRWIFRYFSCVSVPTGKWYYYKSNGELYKIELYKKGKLVRVLFLAE